MSPFSALCNGLYQPLLGTAWKELCSSTDAIAAKYAAQGFPLPPGAMLSEISDRYEQEIAIRAEIIFECCCQAYKASSQNSKTEDFSTEIQDAIKFQQSVISASGEDVLKRYMAHNHQNSQQVTSIYNQKISTEGMRLLTYYSARATAFLGESTAKELTRINGSVHHWYQRPIGIVGITIFAGLIVLFATYLIKHHLDIQL